jgi:hypothetical protein
MVAAVNAFRVCLCWLGCYLLPLTFAGLPATTRPVSQEERATSLLENKPTRHHRMQRLFQDNPPQILEGRQLKSKSTKAGKKGKKSSDHKTNIFNIKSKKSKKSKKAKSAKKVPSSTEVALVTADFSAATSDNPINLFAVSEGVGEESDVLVIVSDPTVEVYVVSAEGDDGSSTCPPQGGKLAPLAGNSVVIPINGIDKIIILCSGGLVVGRCYHRFLQSTSSSGDVSRIITVSHGSFYLSDVSVPSKRLHTLRSSITNKLSTSVLRVLRILFFSIFSLGPEWWGAEVQVKLSLGEAEDGLLEVANSSFHHQVPSTLAIHALRMTL